MNREELAERVDAVRRGLREAAEEGGWPVPRLVVVTKTHPAEEILPLAELGVTEIGENRVQELREKLPALGDRFQVHLIGRLQRNKVKYIVGDVCMIQSVDSLPLAEEIHRRASEKGVRVPVLLEVNPAGEAQKGGVPPEEVRSLIGALRDLDGLRIRGLMAVMPQTEDRELLEKLFRGMRTLFDQLRGEAVSGVEMETLSMGMSGDYLQAARCGATMVRVGSAILGPRG